MTSGRTVYSTGPGGGGGGLTRCRRCGAAPCRCGPTSSVPPEKQAVRVRRERAGRAGKTVTIVAPVVLVRDEAAALLSDLKRLCGGGGTLRVDPGPDGRPAFTLEVQGDHAEKILAELLARGFPAKRSGG
jgi:translation initiation factor 1